MVHRSSPPLAAVFAVVLALGAGACGEDPGPVPVASGAWAEVDSLDTTAFREAWARARTMDHERTVRIDELDSDGGTVAYVERVVRYRAADSSSVTIGADSSGSFRAGLFDEIGGTPRAADPLPYVLPEDASFRSARNRERYEVVLQADSAGTSEQIRIAALPGAGDADPVRRVEYRVAGGRLVSVEIDRKDDALLFTDRSRAVAGTLDDGAGGLLPDVFEYETWIRPRIGHERRYRITNRWTYPSR